MNIDEVGEGRMGEGEGEGGGRGRVNRGEWAFVERELKKELY